MSAEHISAEQVKNASLSAYRETNGGKYVPVPKRSFMDTNSKSHHGKRFEQLAMLETNETLKDKGYEAEWGERERPASGGPRESEEGMWDRKRAESEQSGLAESVAKEGYYSPVVLNPIRRTYADGHHKKSVASNKSGDPHHLIPVTHSESSGISSPAFLRGDDGKLLPMGRPKVPGTY